MTRDADSQPEHELLVREGKARRRRAIVAHAMLHEYKSDRQLATELDCSTTVIRDDKKAIRQMWFEEIKDSGRELFAEAFRVLDFLRASALEGVQSADYRERNDSIRTAQKVVMDQLKLLGLSDITVAVGSAGMEARPKVIVSPEQADALVGLYDAITVTKTEKTEKTVTTEVTPTSAGNVIDGEVIE